MKEAKYLGMIMDEHLTFKNHMDTVKLKLNRANGLLAKLKHYVNPIWEQYTMPFLTPPVIWVSIMGEAEKLVLQNIEKNPKQSPKNFKF